MTNSLVALWPLVPFDVINFVKTFQQYTLLVTVFFFGKKRSHMLDSLWFFIWIVQPGEKFIRIHSIGILIRWIVHNPNKRKLFQFRFWSCSALKNVICFFFRNIAEPSLTKDYSLLDEGDTIKSIAISPYFLYRLEARERGSNGAIYQAPESYRFVCLLASF